MKDKNFNTASCNSQGYSRHCLVIFEKSSFAIYVDYFKFIYSRSEVIDVLLGQDIS